jgi:hypothetical protein
VFGARWESGARVEGPEGREAIQVGRSPGGGLMANAAAPQVLPTHPPTHPATSQPPTASHPRPPVSAMLRSVWRKAHTMESITSFSCACRGQQTGGRGERESSDSVGGRVGQAGRG